MRLQAPFPSPEERIRLCRQAERADQALEGRFLALVVLLRTGVTVLMPRFGAAGWWMTLLCALPGLATALLLWWAMRRCHAATLTEAAACLWGRWAAVTVGMTAALCLAVEGLACFTALVVLFVEGIGTAASPFIMAVLTAMVLAFCASQAGLRRGVRLLLWPAGLMLLGVAANLLTLARADHLFPLLGSGLADCVRGSWRGLGAGWPLSLLMLVPPVAGQDAGRRPLRPVLAAGAVLLVLTLALPHELLRGDQGLASSLLLAGTYVLPIVRALWLSLWMLGLGLGAAICCTEAGVAALSPMNRALPWLPGALLSIFALVQLMGSATVYQAVTLLQPWLWTPFALLALGLDVTALIKRRRPA